MTKKRGEIIANLFNEMDEEMRHRTETVTIP